MIKLKNTLLNIKKQYFELERQEVELSDEITKQMQWKKRSKIHKTMFKIRVEKQVRKEDIHKIKDLAFERLN